MDDLNRGFKYGDGIFETIKVLNSNPVNIDLHLERLSKSAQKLMLDVSDVNLNNILAFLEEQNAGDGVLKIYLYRHCQSLGYLPLSPQSSKYIYTFTSGLVKWPRQVQTICLSSVARHKCIVGSKTLSSLNFVMARLEANQNNCFDALMLNEDGFVCEFSSANIFILTKDGLLKTPPANGYIVDGVMRKCLINLTEGSAITRTDQAFSGLNDKTITLLEDIKCVEQCNITLQDVREAVKIFYTNAIRGVIEVVLVEAMPS